MKFIRIENINTWLVKEIPSYFPGTKKYMDFWREEKRKCIEGLWGPDFDGYRFMPPNVYFYVNYVIIRDTDEDQNARIPVKPTLRDLEWELGYMWMEARGFSGFEDDDSYCGHHLLKEYLKATPIEKQHIKPHRTWYRKNGELKKYKHPREILRSLHSSPLGRPLYINEAKNTMILGSRGGGKSYFTSGAIVLHELLFDGRKYYDYKALKEAPQIEVFVGAAHTTYSADILEKVSSAMNSLATDPRLGVYGSLTNPEETHYAPNPFYKDMTGSLQPNNKKAPWRHEYEKKIRGKWIKGFGTKCRLYHGIYSTEQPQAAAGTRPSVIVVEEVGLMENLIEPHNSNIAAQTINSKRFGSSIYIGTAGNMEKILESKEIFTHPSSYDMLAYEDEWEATGEICFFLPAYYTNKDFKDENGNTDVERAKAYYLKRREKALKSSNPKNYEGELMNYPIVPSEMFIGREGKILPVAEAKEREKQLLTNKLYERLATPIEIFYDTQSPTGVDYKVLTNKSPIWEFPAPKEQDISGCIVMYERPEINERGEVITDLYNLVGYDPYVSENLDEGESLGAVYIMKNPKYLSRGLGGNTIVASYVGKHPNGTTAFNENVEKLLMMYGSPHRGLWFEANRGKHVKSYFENKHKLHLLCHRPQKEMNINTLKSRVTNYGWSVGNRIDKIALLDMLAEWLKEETEIDGVIKRNIERIPDLALIKEIIAFDLDKGNFDRIMALVGCVLALRETENMFARQVQIKHNPLSVLANNTKLFKNQKQKKLKHG